MNALNTFFISDDIYDNMRGGVVAAGVVFLLLSFFGWMLFVLNPLIGALLCLLSPVFFILGLILFIVGLVISPEQPTQPVVVYAQPMPAPTMNLCPVCGSPLTYYAQNNRWYCHRCRSYRS